MSNGSEAEKRPAEVIGDIREGLDEQEAVELEGRAVAEFAAVPQEAAQRQVELAHVIHLSLEDQRAVADAILNPPEPTPALRRAFRRRSDLISTPR